MIAARCCIPLLTLLTVVTANIFAWSQVNSELNKRNGFKNIKLSGQIDDIQGAKFKKDIKEKDEFPAKLYSINNHAYDQIGEVKVKKVEAKVYKGLIYEIGVIIDKDERLMRAMEKLYGKPHYDLRDNHYTWASSNVKLIFKNYSKNKIKVTYQSHPMQAMMKEDKSKEMSSTADDL